MFSCFPICGEAEVIFVYLGGAAEKPNDDPFALRQAGITLNLLK